MCDSGILDRYWVICFWLDDFLFIDAAIPRGDDDVDTAGLMCELFHAYIPAYFIRASRENTWQANRRNQPDYRSAYSTASPTAPVFPAVENSPCPLDKHVDDFLTRLLLYERASLNRQKYCSDERLRCVENNIWRMVSMKFCLPTPILKLCARIRLFTATLCRSCTRILTKTTFAIMKLIARELYQLRHKNFEVICQSCRDIAQMARACIIVGDQTDLTIDTVMVL